MNLNNAIFIRQPTLTTISNEDLAQALPLSHTSVGSVHIVLDQPRLRLEDLPTLDWAAIHDHLLSEISSKLSAALSTLDGPIVYFGMTAIPVAMELGSKIGTTRRVLVFQQHHNTKSWKWNKDAVTVTVRTAGVPTQEVRTKGDVILRVSCSHRVDEASTRLAVPYSIAEIDIVVENLHEDVLNSQADIDLVAKEFGVALDAIRRWYPNTETIHCFASVPAGLAFRMGCEINPNIHRPIQTYQFNGRGDPRQLPALVLGEEPRIGLTPEQTNRARQVRELFKSSLAQLSWLKERSNKKNWHDAILPGDTSVIPNSILSLGPASPSIPLFDARVSASTSAGGEFLWNPETREWTFDDALLAAIGSNLSDREVELAGRLFLLHEAIHIKSQGLTTASAGGVGMLPRILEDADYVADVWSVLHELGRTIANEKLERDDVTRFALELVKTMTRLFWAFDAGSRPLRDIQVRRLNRYLIWHWQRLLLERAHNLSDVLRILAVKPVLEVSGPRVFVARGRVLFDLDPIHFRNLEFGALLDGRRIARVGTRSGASAAELLTQLRNRNGPGFYEALRGIFDAVNAVQT